jgi:hypothetical protein
MSIEQLKIIFVPGKNPKPKPEVHRQQLWRCLLHGVTQVNPVLARELSQHPDIFELASWNYLYYRRHKGLDRDLPWIEHLLTRNASSADEREKIYSFRVRLGRLIYHLADLFPFLVRFAPDPAVKAAVQETKRYFENQDRIAWRIREVLKKILKDAWTQQQRVLLIGHSMGSIISYDTLWELGREEGYQGKVDLFLTIGSPLGMRYVQHRLVDAGVSPSIRYPNNIRHWVNIASMGDLTALDPYLAGDFEDMVNQGLVESIRDEHRDVYNFFVDAKGLNVHRSYGYLANSRVGKVITDWVGGADPTGVRQ